MGTMLTIGAPPGAHNSYLPRPTRAPHAAVPVVPGEAANSAASAHKTDNPLRPAMTPRLLIDPSAIRVTQSRAAKGGAAQAKPGELSEDQQAEVADLKARDTEVRRHEEAHARAGGAYASAPKYEFKGGPDGHQYAVGGSVAMDVAAVEGDPDATIRKMQVVKRAATAPTEPSGQDRSVAAQADAKIQQARAEMSEQRAEANTGAGAFAKSAQAYAQTASLIAL